MIETRRSPGAASFARSILSFDIGGSFIKAAIVEGERTTILGRVPTPLDDADHFGAALRGFLDAANPGPDIVTISIAGVIDPEDGRIRCANIPGIDGRRLARDLETTLSCEVIVANDADCFALAEAHLGAGQGKRIVFGAILGTGVGGGLVIDGQLIQGAGGLTGEWGHGPIAGGNKATSFPCGCGQTGCLDAVGGARGLERLHDSLHGRRLDSHAIIQAWQAGEAAAATTVALHVDLVSTGLAIVVNTVGASTVPVGGGLGSVSALVQDIDRATRAKILRRTEEPLVVQAKCNQNPGIVGAALLGAMHVKRQTWLPTRVTTSAA